MCFVNIDDFSIFWWIVVWLVILCGFIGDFSSWSYFFVHTFQSDAFYDVKSLGPWPEHLHTFNEFVAQLLVSNGGSKGVPRPLRYSKKYRTKGLLGSQCILRFPGPSWGYPQIIPVKRTIEVLTLVVTWVSHFGKPPLMIRCAHHLRKLLLFAWPCMVRCQHFS